VPTTRWCFLAALALLLGASAGLPARAQPLPPATLKSVKDATVLLKVTLPSGQVVSGSGFFAHAPGVIITNAHVLGMLDPDGRKPQKVEVVLRSGEEDSRTLNGEVLGVDRGTDLGVLKVTAQNLPAPLPPKSANGLNELDELYAFGFPFGEQLGKNISVTKTSVSSLRKNGSFLDRIQVSGGIHPGNSGGPLTDAKGRVVGVAVSGVRNTQIHFAIPSDHMLRYLNGRITSLVRNVSYRDGGRVMMPVTVEFLDPLGGIKRVVVEVFAALDGPARDAADKAPLPKPGDSAIKSATLKYDHKTGAARGDVELPPLPTPNHRYYARPVLTDAVGKTRWYAAIPEVAKLVADRTPLRLMYRPTLGEKPAEIQSNGEFKFRDMNDEEFSLGLNVRVGLKENARDPVKAQFSSLFQTTGFAMTLTRDGNPLPADADLRAISAATQFVAFDVDRGATGAWARSRTDVGRVPVASREAVSDIGEQLLTSLELVTIPMPNREVKALQTWTAKRNVVVGTALIAMLGAAELKYTYSGVVPRAGKKVALVEIEGTIRGRAGAGLDVGGSVSGHAEVDPETGEVIACDAEIKADADLLTARKETIKAVGTMTVGYRGSAPPPAKK
jgi:S1-C subfamily serine protease